MNSTIIDEINCLLEENLLKNFTGSEIYGLSQSVIRKRGNETDYLPCIVDKEGECKYIGVDDTKVIIIYHKTGNITCQTVGEPVGNNSGKQRNTYQNTMIVYVDTKRTGLTPDELFLYIQSGIPENMAVRPYTMVSVKINGVILNTQTVFATEYKGRFFIPPHAYMFAVNYNIESTHIKGCFDKCPEDKNC